MSKSKPTAGDRHKPRKMVGVPTRIATVLEELGAERETNLTEMVKVACIHYLESLGKWPPPAKPGK